MKRKGGIFFAAVMLACLMVLSACSEDTGAGSESSFLFAVGAEKCSVKEARVYLANMRGVYENVSGADLWTVVESGDASAAEELADLALTRLLYIYCLDQMAADADVSLSDAEEDTIAQAAAAYLATLTDADRDYLDADADEIGEYYAHFALAEKCYAQITADVTAVQDASADAGEDAAAEEKAAVFEAAFEAFVAGVEIAVDEEVLASLVNEAQDASADTSVTTNRFFSVYNEYMGQNE